MLQSNAWRSYMCAKLLWKWTNSIALSSARWRRHCRGANMHTHACIIDEQLTMTDFYTGTFTHKYIHICIYMHILLYGYIHTYTTIYIHIYTYIKTDVATIRIYIHTHPRQLYIHTTMYVCEFELTSVWLFPSLRN